MPKLLNGLLILALLAPLAAWAQTAEEKGLAIAQEADKRDTGWSDETADLKMILRNRHGDESTREIRTRTLEMNGDGDKSLSIFDTPADVKKQGSAFDLEVGAVTFYTVDTLSHRFWNAAFSCFSLAGL